MKQRTIKFRGKSIPHDNHESRWVYGHYFISPLTDENSGTQPEAGWFFLTGEKRHCIATENGSVFVVYPESVSQYTGELDKTQTEIYENDIDSNGQIVSFNLGGFMLVDQSGAYEDLLGHKTTIVDNLFESSKLISK